MKHRFRLTRSSDFRRVRREGKSFAHPLIVLICTTNSTSQTRIGVTVGKSVGNAVNRNRTKRRIRACVDRWLMEIKPEYDLVIIGRKRALNIEFAELDAAVSSLLRKADLLK